MATDTNGDLSVDQLGVIHQLLLQSPPGELHVVLEEIKDLLNGQGIPSAFLENSIREYNLTHNVLVDVRGASRPLLLYGSVDDDSNVYSDVVDGKCYLFDHVRNAIESELDYAEPLCQENMQKLYRSLIEEGKKYVETRFTERSNVFVSIDGDHIDILVVGEMIKLRNYYTGRWVSRYSLDVSESMIFMAGAIDIATHYFENGNVRMDVHKDMDPTSLSYPVSGVSQKVFQKIAAFEDGVQEGLLSAFSSMKQDSLKEFRRQLPKTHQHFTWIVNAHRMADTMKETKLES